MKNLFVEIPGHLSVLLEKPTDYDISQILKIPSSQITEQAFWRYMKKDMDKADNLLSCLMQSLVSLYIQSEYAEVLQYDSGILEELKQYRMKQIKKNGAMRLM